MNRFFIAESDLVYEAVRSTLDSHWGLPAAGQETCFSPAAAAVRDERGRPMLAVAAAFCNYEAVSAILPQLLASGAIQEVGEATYRASVPPTPTP